MEASIYFLSLASPLLQNTQSTERHVFDTAGGSVMTGINSRMDYTVGDVALTTICAGSTILTQGLLQPGNQIVANSENPLLSFSIIIFPYLFNEHPGLSPESDSRCEISVRVFDLSDQQIITSSTLELLSGKALININTFTLASGTYILHVMEDVRCAEISKIFKFNQ